MKILGRHLGRWLRRNRAYRAGPAYDAWLHFGTADVCNLRCSYCISDSEGFPARKSFGGKCEAIDVERLLQTLDDSGRTYKIVFAGGGEPFLIPNLVDALVALTRRHYVALHSNLTLAQPLAAMVERVDPRRVLYFNASLHADELDRTGLTQPFFEALDLLRERAFPVSVHAVAHPDFLPSAGRWRARLHEKGIDLKLDPFLGTHDGKSYPEAYSQTQRNELGLGDLSIFRTRGKPCNAGFNVGLVLANGDVRFCSEVDRKLGNIYERLEFRDEATVCPVETCRCPFYAHDRQLFLAMTEGMRFEKRSLPLERGVEARRPPSSDSG